MNNETQFWLSLDVASPKGSVALHEFRKAGTHHIWSADLSSSQKHSEELLSVLDEGLRRHSLSLGNIDGVLLPSGPGSFTGLRVGMAYAKAFALHLGKIIETLDPSEIRALSWLASNFSSMPERVLVHAHTGSATGICSVFIPEGRERVRLDKEEEVGDHAVATGPGTVVLTEAEWPLMARRMGDFRLKAGRRKQFIGQEQIVSLAPTYFGDKRFGLFPPPVKPHPKP